MTVHSETFVKANSTILGPNLTWAEVAGNVQIVSNRCRVVTADGGTNYARADADVTTPNMYAQIVVPTYSVVVAGQVAGVCARCDPGGAITFYLAQLSFSSPNHIYRIFRGVSGVFTQLGSSVIVTVSVPETMRLLCLGNEISLFRGSSRIIGPIVDPAPIMTGTRGGMRIAAATATGNMEVGSFEVGDFIPPTPAPAGRAFLMPGSISTGGQFVA